jgi:23S rRNA pseudouridine1911/1915/1917 synthase
VKAGNPPPDPDDELDASDPDGELPLPRIPAEPGERLDKWLAAQLPEHSRAVVQRWIDGGHVTLCDRPLKASHRVVAGETIAVRIPPPDDYTVEPEPIPLTILYEDADLLVVDKPAGMVVHPAAGNWHGTLVNAVLYHAPDLVGVGGAQRPGIVHRLDKDTSGLILVAKNDAAHRTLQAQFEARTVQKVYQALVFGRMSPPEGLVDAAIGRDARDRKRMAVLPPGQGRAAQTRYAASAFYRATPHPGVARFTLVACYPLTGRTHQIRVHLAHIGYPVVGDTLYAGRRKTPFACPRQFLHAHSLRFRLPATGAERTFTSPLPPDLAGCLARLRPEE